MKKYLVILLSILLCFLVFPVSVSADEWTDVTAPNQIVTNIDAKYRLQNDISLTSLINFGTVDKTIEIDLNGYTLNGPTDSYCFRVAGATLTISDSSVGKTGKILTRASDQHRSIFWLVGGVTSHVIINGGTFDGSSLTTVANDGAMARIETASTFVINGGTFQNFSTTKNGGLFYIMSDGATLTINGGTFTHNSAFAGGVVYTKNASYINLLGGTFTDNQVTYDGGVAFIAGGCQMLVDGATLSNNVANARGGAICATADGTLLRIDSGTFSNNTVNSYTAYSGGGAIAIFDQANLLMNGGNIIGNSAYYGGGIRIRKAYATINNCNIKENNANAGGGIIAQGIDTPLQTNCLVLNGGYIGENNASKGGAVYIGGTAKAYLNAGTLTNNIAQNGGAVYVGTLGYGILSNLSITNNTASYSGGGIFVARGSRSSISNVTITGNTAANAGGIFIDDDCNMSNINVTNNSASVGTGGIYVESADYDGESYYSTIVKLDGSSVVYNNIGSHKNLYIASNSIVNGTANGFSDSAKIGVEIADSNLKKTFVGRYNYQENGNEYIITKYYKNKIIYHCDGATIGGDYPTGYNDGQTVTLPTNVTKPDATFLGWYDNDAFAGNPITTITSSETGDKDFYANFEYHHDHGSYTEGIDTNVEWIPWTRSDSLPSYTSLGDQNAYYNKHYYLTCDVYLTAKQVIQRTVTIDLNGYSVYKAPNATFTGAFIEVNGKWANPLTITNCKATFDSDGFLSSEAGFHDSYATGTEGAVIVASGDATKNEYPNVRLYGINFQDNYCIRTSNDEWMPGAIFWKSRQNLIVKDCSFIDNISGSAPNDTSTYGAGGAITIKEPGTVNISNTLFDGNKAGQRGAAILIPSGVNATLNINGSKFVNNKTVYASSSNAGVLGLQAGTTSITNTEFTNNINAGGNGTVITAQGNANVSLNNVSITGNRNTNTYSTYRSAVSIIGAANLTVSGNTIVDDNTNSNNKEANIFLRTSSTGNPKIATGTLGENALMGVDTNATVDADNKYIVVEGKRVKDKFFADNDNYIVKHSGNNTVLGTPGVEDVTGNLVIADNIDANIEITLDGEPSDYTMKYTFLGEEHNVDVTSKTVNIEVNDIYSFQMAEPITIEVTYKGNLIDTIVYSVKEYCKTAIETSNDAKLVNLCKATLNYGTASQIYFDGKTYAGGTYDTTSSGLANDGVETTLVDSSQPSNVKNRVGDLGGLVTSVNYSLILGSDVSMKFYITTNTPLDLDELVVGCSPVKTLTDVVLEPSGKYSVKVTGLKTSELGSNFNLTFMYGGQEMTVTYSPYAFANAKWNDDTNLAALCKKLVTYGDMAIAYKQ